MTLLALYVGALAFGGILVGASVLGVGKDADGDHGDLHHGDLDHGHLDHDGGDDLDHAGDASHVSHDHLHANDVGAGVGSLLVSNLTSLRFWTFGLAAFGLCGLLLTLGGIPSLVGLAVAAAVGLGIGWGAATVVRSLARDTRATELRTSTLQGREATVVLAVASDKVGKIRIVHAGQTIELPCTTQEARRIERGETVLVVEVRGGTATVTPVMPERGRVLMDGERTS